MLNAAYNANYHIVQAPGYVMILTEMIHDVRIIPLDGRPAPPGNVRQWMGRLARTVGRQHAGGRDDQLQRQESAGRLQREHAGDGAVHARGRRHDPIHLHRRGSLDMDEAVDRRNADGDDVRDRSSSMPATRGITACTTPSLAPGSKRRRRPRRRLPHPASKSPAKKETGMAPCEAMPRLDCRVWGYRPIFPADHAGRAFLRMMIARRRALGARPPSSRPRSTSSGSIGLSGLYVDDAGHVLFGRALAAGHGYTMVNAPMPGLSRPARPDSRRCSRWCF